MPPWACRSRDAGSPLARVVCRAQRDGLVVSDPVGRSGGCRERWSTCRSTRPRMPAACSPSSSSGSCRSHRDRAGEPRACPVRGVHDPPLLPGSPGWNDRHRGLRRRHLAGHDRRPQARHRLIAVRITVPPAMSQAAGDHRVRGASARRRAQAPTRSGLAAERSRACSGPSGTGPSTTGWTVTLVGRGRRTAAGAPPPMRPRSGDRVEAWHATAYSAGGICRRGRWRRDHG